MFIPISTSTSIRRTPFVNYGIIALNVLIYVVMGGAESPRTEFARQFFDFCTLDGMEPRIWQFMTYQFLHAGMGHLAGNMLFLWVFGNSVNGKMGHWLYACFYLASGVFAAVGYGLFVEHGMVGASGSIAAITTAYFALFPRSYITVLYWFLIIGTWELPSMWMIGFKLVLYDNIIAPNFEGGSNVAYGAHLAGYLFGFGVPLLLLWLRVIARDQFDILALWRRWWQRRQMEGAMMSPDAKARAQYGRVARPVSVEDIQVRDPHQEKITTLRGDIVDAIGQTDRDRAADLYVKLLELDPRQVLARPQQLDVANQLYSQNKLPQAAAAYEKYLNHYPNAPDGDHVKLLLGIIYARDLHQYEVAEGHLKQLLEKLTDQKRIEQCQHWLSIVDEGLGREQASAEEPAPE